MEVTGKEKWVGEQDSLVLGAICLEMVPTAAVAVKGLVLFG